MDTWMQEFSIKVRDETPYRLMALLFLCSALPACVNQTIKSASAPAVKTASTVVVEDLLLDFDDELSLLIVIASPSSKKSLWKLTAACPFNDSRHT